MGPVDRLLGAREDGLCPPPDPRRERLVDEASRHGARSLVLIIESNRGQMEEETEVVSRDPKIGRAHV